MCIAQDLTDQVREYQRRTGESQMLVVVEDDGRINGVHQVGYEEAVGLLVDGRPPSVVWYQHLEGFHALEAPPAVLH